VIQFELLFLVNANLTLLHDCSVRTQFDFSFLRRFLRVRCREEFACDVFFIHGPVTSWFCWSYSQVLKVRCYFLCCN